jgi:hypothetical protein
MQLNVSCVERAFQIARSSGFTRMEDVRQQLKHEGYTDHSFQLQGPTIRRQLQSTMMAAKNAQ